MDPWVDPHKVAGMRFVLAHDRVRDLLMGENLYGDKWLALREMYQNAVDACRLAQARYTYLARTANNPVTDEPDERLRIDFRQGLDDGRPYVECTDTGVGMDLTQISTVFCQAGIRAADLPGYVAELNDYANATPPIELWTNSRFGIGVLSYFMLAHAVEVHTTRMHRDGTLGHTYQVLIPGPGTCFRVQDLGPGTAPGTTVRLWLTGSDETTRSDAVTALEDVVAVAAFPMTAHHSVAGKHAQWQPGELSEAFVNRTGLYEFDRTIASARHGIWWCTGRGQVFCDGIVTDKPWSCHVNLTGPHAPRLSVDRKQVLEMDTDHIETLMRAGLGDLLDGPAQVRNPIITKLVSRTSALADEMVHRARAQGVTISTSSRLCGTTDLLRGTVPRFDDLSRPTTPFTAWRVSAALAAADNPPPELDVAAWPRIADGLPSDSHFDMPWCGGSVGSRAHVALAATIHRREPAEIVARCVELGYLVEAGTDLILTEQDRALLLGRQTAHYTMMCWAVSRGTVRLNLVADAADAAGLSLAQAHTRLTELGLPCAPLRGIATLASWERQLFTRTTRGAQLSAVDIVDVADQHRLQPATVHQRACELGLDVGPPPAVWDDDPRMRTVWDEYSPDELTLLTTAALTRRIGVPVDQMIVYVTAMGADLPDPAGDCPEIPFLSDPFLRSITRAASTAATAATDAPEKLVPLLRWARVELVGPDISDLDRTDIDLVGALQRKARRDDNDYSQADVTASLNPFLAMRAAREAGLDAAETASRLARLGYSLADHIPEPTTVNLDATSLDGHKTLTPGDTVPLTAVLHLVNKHHLTIDQALTVYRVLGLHPEDPRDLLPVVRPGDGLPDRTRQL
ncbi:MAG: hypothetical protein FWD11_06585 [Micrococcales bacterium]|nr:hypothetical protein [Micrococcales bacterium]